MKEKIEKIQKSIEKLKELTEEEIKNMIEIIRGEISKRIDIIEEAYKVENEGEINKERIIESINIEKYQYGSKKIMKNEYGNILKIYVPYGIIGVIYDGNIYNTIEIIIKSIQTRNGIVLSTYKKLGIIYIIVEEIKRVLKQIEVEEIIQIENEMTKILKEEKINKIIYIGRRESYENIKVETNKEMLYSGYGNYEMYIEEEIDKELVEKIRKEEGVKVYNELEIEEAIKKINEEGGMYSVGIMTSSREKARRFIEGIKASNVLVNASPTLVDKLNIECMNLTYLKNVLVYEE